MSLCEPGSRANPGRGSRSPPPGAALFSSSGLHAARGPGGAIQSEASRRRVCVSVHVLQSHPGLPSRHSGNVSLSGWKLVRVPSVASEHGSSGLSAPRPLPRQLPRTSAPHLSPARAVCLPFPQCPGENVYPPIRSQPGCPLLSAPVSSLLSLVRTRPSAKQTLAVVSGHRGPGAPTYGASRRGPHPDSPSNPHDPERGAALRGRVCGPHHSLATATAAGTRWAFAGPVCQAWQPVAAPAVGTVPRSALPMRKLGSGGPPATERPGTPSADVRFDPKCTRGRSAPIRRAAGPVLRRVPGGRCTYRSVSAPPRLGSAPGGSLFVARRVCRAAEGPAACLTLSSSAPGHCQGDGYRVGFGQCAGKVLPALLPA